MRRLAREFRPEVDAISLLWRSRTSRRCSLTRPAPIDLMRLRPSMSTRSCGTHSSPAIFSTALA